MADKLVTLAAEDLSSVRDLFKVDWPKHIISYSTIETLIKKFEKNPSLQDEIKIFCLNGDWARDGTFILHFQVRWLIYTEECRSVKIFFRQRTTSSLELLMTCAIHFGWPWPCWIFGFPWNSPVCVKLIERLFLTSLKLKPWKSI